MMKNIRDMFTKYGLPAAVGAIVVFVILAMLVTIFTPELLDLLQYLE